MIALAAALLLSPVQEPPACTARDATRTSVAAIGDNPERFIGRCVTVSGLASGVAIFSGVEGFYRTNRYGVSGNSDPGDLRRHRIGLYARNNALRRMAAETQSALWITATGRVSTCRHDMMPLQGRERACS